MMVCSTQLIVCWKQVAAIEEQRRSAEVVRKLHEELAVLYNNHAAALKKAGESPG